MAQDVGPILEMVTEKYLPRSEAEWKAAGSRGDPRSNSADLRAGDMRRWSGYAAEFLRAHPNDHSVG
jgi:hypothetical protein